MTEVPAPRNVTAEDDRPYLICVAADAESRARLARALSPSDVVVMVPDTESALDLLRRKAEQDRADPLASPLGAGGATYDPVPAHVRLDGLHVDRDQAMVTWHGHPVDLSQLEIDVLACLVHRPGRVWTYQQLYAAAWDAEYYGDRNSVHSLVKRLRRKLREADISIDLHAVRGVGFQVRVDSVGAGSLRPV